MIWVLLSIVICKQPNHDFGILQGSKIQRHAFVLHNTGKEPISILNISASCSCTVVKFPKTIQPGKSEKIEVSFDPKELHGKVERNIIIITNAQQPYLMLKITAFVR